MALEFINGAMATNMKEIGKKENLTVKENIFTAMAPHFQVLTSTEKNTEKAFLLKKMEMNMKDSGNMVNEW